MIVTFSGRDHLRIVTFSERDHPMIVTFSEHDHLKIVTFSGRHYPQNMIILIVISYRVSQYESILGIPIVIPLVNHYRSS